jgi:hypothetical protein
MPQKCLIVVAMIIDAERMSAKKGLITPKLREVLGQQAEK